MLAHLDPVLLSRMQFAFIIAFHILFPSFTIGLASWLAVLQWRWLRTGNPVYGDVYHMWIKIFAVVFGMGVVSGVVMSFQFGTNWAAFADRAGNILGPLLGYEVLTAFFLEASFLGVMLFGKNRVGPKTYFAANIIVALGTLLSAFWILAANSWMQTPRGYTIAANGLIYPADWKQIIFNPSFPFRFVHMVTAAYLTTAFVAGGVGAWYLLQSRHTRQARIMFGMAMIMAIFVSPLQLLFGDAHGRNTFEYQPEKVAAMEGLWETQRGAPSILFGWPDQKDEVTKYAIEIPKLSSLILTHKLDGMVRGLKEWPKEDRPPVPLVFFAFRAMVVLGVLMILTGLTALVLFFRKHLFDTRWFLRWCVAMSPAGFLAVLAGWCISETGRQPWVIEGIMRTSQAVSPVKGFSVALSFCAFVLTYGVVFGAGVHYIVKLIKKGPEAPGEIYGSHGLSQPPLITDPASKKD
ncbi:MAG: cytochrome ubiquinol oxidase subunit I [Syntrophobacteraceae bacterium]|nr:cytochrome ubiquinol oxidase subunit I [Syntrophobacteraceae bacterium]